MPASDFLVGEYVWVAHDAYSGQVGQVLQTSEGYVHVRVGTGVLAMPPDTLRVVYHENNAWHFRDTVEPAPPVVDDTGGGEDTTPPKPSRLSMLLEGTDMPPEPPPKPEKSSGCLFCDAGVRRRTLGRVTTPWFRTK